jgi:hypothetical protein
VTVYTIEACHLIQEDGRGLADDRVVAAVPEQVPGGQVEHRGEPIAVAQQGEHVNGDPDDPGEDTR